MTIDLRNHPAPATYLAENRLLGYLIADSSWIPEARKIIDAACFSDPTNENVWRMLLTAYDHGEDISLETFYSRVNAEHFRRNLLDYATTGTHTFGEMANAIDALREAAVKRRAYFVATRLLEAASSSAPVDTLLDIPRDFVTDEEARLTDRDARKAVDVMNELGEVLQKRANDIAEGKPLRVPTGFANVDWLTYGGFAKGNLVILAARPSVGKTAVMLQSARAAAALGIPVTVYSLEMTNLELAQRMACALAPIRQADIAQGSVDWNDFETASGKVAGLPMWLNDKAHTLDEIVAKITTAHRRGQCDAAYIDYLGLISFRNDQRSLYQQVSEATRRLKILAKECEIPVVLLCQLNRDMSRQGRAPQLHDLRDSGSIEQDADIVLMLERSLGDEPDQGPSRTVNMYVRKNRQGRVGDCLTLEANESFTNFIETNKV